VLSPRIFIPTWRGCGADHENPILDGCKKPGTPGHLRQLLPVISAMSWSRVNRLPLDSGFNMIVVSIISTGAGSVAVSAWPNFTYRGNFIREARDDFVLPRHNSLHLAQRSAGQQYA
jgi:hypothetical protein